MPRGRPFRGMVLSFRDSLTGRVGPLEVPAQRPVGMYICGPTVYAPSHVGHARTYLYFDIVRRALLERGVASRVVRNITDYEDKVTWRAESLGITWRALARQEERRFHRDLARLRVLPVEREPRASRFVPRMIEVGRRLEKTGRVERRGETWVYTPPAPSGRNFAIGDDFAVHAVPEPGHPASADGALAREIVVWHRQEPPLAAWTSPWGPGAPGWHLECYAMALCYLGIPVDLHGGGMDLIFPHHYAENTIALALDGLLFSRRFLHTGFVTQLHRKMSKSRGNLVSLGAALDTYGPDALRWYLLSRPYNSRLEWNPTEAGRFAEEWEEVKLRLRGVVLPGAGGNLTAKRLEGLADRVRDRVEDQVAVDAALQELRSYAAEVGAAGSSHLARGEAVRGRGSLRRIEALLGLEILSPPPGR
jgi:cysteinyl-tRNA synthetase